MTTEHTDGQTNGRQTYLKAKLDRSRGLSAFCFLQGRQYTCINRSRRNLGWKLYILWVQFLGWVCLSCRFYSWSRRCLRVFCQQAIDSIGDFCKFKLKLKTVDAELEVGVDVDVERRVLDLDAARATRVRVWKALRHRVEYGDVAQLTIRWLRATMKRLSTVQPKTLPSSTDGGSVYQVS